MRSHILLAFFAMVSTPVAMCSAGIALFLIGAWAAKNDVIKARGLDKIAALSNMCFAMPLAVFGALHLSDPHSLLPIVPRYMPWRMFWVYFVGFALIAASLSIATRIGVRWSGLLFGIMMFLFDSLLTVRGVIAQPHNRIFWALLLREMSFGGAGWILAASARNGWRGKTKTVLMVIGSLFIALAAILFGVEQILHPMGLPGVPLEKEMPPWIPARALIDCVTGAALLVAGASILLRTKTRTVVTCVGGWILLTVLFIYGPVLIQALAQGDNAVKVEGINYFFDTLLFVGALLVLASASPAISGLKKEASTSAS